MDLFSINLSISKMKEITGTKNCTVSDMDEGSYLTWEAMKWKIYGDVRVYNESLNMLCWENDGISEIYLTGLSRFRSFFLLSYIKCKLQFFRYFHRT